MILMSRPTVTRPRALAAALFALGCAAPALAQDARPRVNTPVGAFGQNSRQPINIEADELRVLQKEEKAVYSGSVVAVQGDTTMKCSSLHVIFETKGGGDNRKKTPINPTAVNPAAGGSESAIKRLECYGPVSVVSKDQVATGNNAVYDRVAGLVVLTGNVALSQGGNVTRGGKMTYNINTGIATMEGGRVRGYFEPGSNDTKKPATR